MLTASGSMVWWPYPVLFTPDAGQALLLAEVVLRLLLPKPGAAAPGSLYPFLIMAFFFLISSLFSYSNHVWIDFIPGTYKIPGPGAVSQSAANQGILLFLSWHGITFHSSPHSLWTCAMFFFLCLQSDLGPAEHIWQHYGVCALSKNKKTMYRDWTGCHGESTFKKSLQYLRMLLETGSSATLCLVDLE